MNHDLKLHIDIKLTTRMSNIIHLESGSNVKQVFSIIVFFGTFYFILLLGLIYAWRKGVLRWV